MTRIIAPTASDDDELTSELQFFTRIPFDGQFCSFFLSFCRVVSLYASMAATLLISLFGRPSRARALSHSISLLSCLSLSLSERQYRCDTTLANVLVRGADDLFVKDAIGGETLLLSSISGNCMRVHFASEAECDEWRDALVRAYNAYALSQQR